MVDHCFRPVSMATPQCTVLGTERPAMGVRQPACAAENPKRGPECTLSETRYCNSPVIREKPRRIILEVSSQKSAGRMTAFRTIGLHGVELADICRNRATFPRLMQNKVQPIRLQGLLVPKVGPLLRGLLAHLRRWWLLGLHARKVFAGLGPMVGFPVMVASSG